MARPENRSEARSLSLTCGGDLQLPGHAGDAWKTSEENRGKENRTQPNHPFFLLSYLLP